MALHLEAQRFVHVGCEEREVLRSKRRSVVVPIVVYFDFCTVFRGNTSIQYKVGFRGNNDTNWN